MLRTLNNLLILLYIIGFSETLSAASCSISKKSCSHTNTEFETEILKLVKDSYKKVEALQQDQDFQTLVGELKNQTPPPLQSQRIPGELYIFVSFSMGEKALLNLAHEAKIFGATLILRGFKGGNYKKTAQALQKVIEKTGQGFLIDPELYTLFNITSVPTFILTKPFDVSPQERIATPLHDRLQGHVSIRYALETFAKSGEFQAQAQLMLRDEAK